MSVSRTTPNTISAIDKKAHAFKRRIQNQVFSDAGLKTVEKRVMNMFKNSLHTLDQMSMQTSRTHHTTARGGVPIGTCLVSATT